MVGDLKENVTAIAQRLEISTPAVSKAAIQEGNYGDRTKMGVNFEMESFSFTSQSRLWNGLLILDSKTLLLVYLYPIDIEIISERF